MKTDDAIDIQVNTEYLQDHSDPQAQRYAYAYTVEITNRGEAPVKLLTRHWQIMDDNNHIEEVHGDGVVGVQPIINPGQSFNYTSGTIIGTEFGTMQGSYDMMTAGGRRFRADIPAFLLARPHSVH